MTAVLDRIFMQILDMSGIAGFVILIVILARFLLKRAPKVISYGLWFAVIFRLLCPLAPEAPVSIVPKLPSVADSYRLPEVSHLSVGENRTLSNDDSYGSRNGTGIERTEPLTEEIFVQGIADAPVPQNTWIAKVKYIWVMGIVAMAGYAVASWLRLKRRLKGAVWDRDTVYLSDYIVAPFVLGLLRPRIYLPSALSWDEQEYILLHERHHIRRGDHIVKALAFTALCIHWFNPLVWIAFVLFTGDMEMSCDEAVIRKAGEGIRADYSASLLRLAAGHSRIAGFPLAFGEGDTKGRIKNLANRKKPVLGAVIAAAAAGLALAVGLLTNPLTSSGAFGQEPENLSANRRSIRPEDDGASSIDAAVSAAILAQEEPELLDVEIAALLDTICGSPAEASNPGAYIEAHPKEYARLAAYGEFTLRYCMNRFLQGDETGLKGHVMMSVCETIAEEWGEELLTGDVTPATGQDWFAAVRAHAEELSEQYEDQELEKYYPVSYILLKMMGESDEGRQTF